MKKTFEILDFSIKESDIITKYFDQQERSNIMFFCLSMLERLSFSSHSLKILINEISNNTKVEYSCGIIVRAVLLDYMILLNAIEILLSEDDAINNNTEIHKFCSTWLADSLNHTIKNISILYSDRTNEQRSTMYSEIVKRNPDFFEPYKQDGSVPVYRMGQAPKAIDLYRVIKNGKLGHNPKIYEVYLYYSKYDHFGQMFHELSREKIADRLDRLNKAIYFFPHMLSYSITILIYLDDKDSFLIDKHNKCISFLKDLNEN